MSYGYMVLFSLDLPVRTEVMCMWRLLLGREIFYYIMSGTLLVQYGTSFDYLFFRVERWHSMCWQ